MNKESLNNLKEDYILVANQYAECDNYEDAICILQQIDGVKHQEKIIELQNCIEKLKGE